MDLSVSSFVSHLSLLHDSARCEFVVAQHDDFPMFEMGIVQDILGCDWIDCRGPFFS